MAESPKHGTTSSLPDRHDERSRLAESLPTPEALSLRIKKYLEASPAAKLVALLSQYDSDAILVGGAVRDLALSRVPSELDFASQLSAEQAMEILEKHSIKVVPTGLQHGTVMAVVGENFHCEITTLRTSLDFDEESNASSESIQLRKDLAARDFTINAIAYGLHDCTVFDPQHGLKDLAALVLQCCGSAHERFKEDPVRVLRMVRFGPAQGRSISDPTLTAAKSFVKNLASIAPERIQQEFSKIMVSEHPREALEAMRESGIFDVILPEILLSIGFEQNEFHSEDVYQHTLSVVEATPPDLTLRLAALFHDFGKPHTLSVDEEGRRHFYEHELISEELAKRVLTRLKYSHEMIKNVALLAKMHMRPLQCGMGGVRRLMRDLDTQFERWRGLKRADHPGALEQIETDKALDAFDAMVAAEKERLELDQRRKLVIDGYDLMALGVPAGKELGQIILHLQDLVLEDPEVNTKDSLIAAAKQYLARKD